MQPGQNIQNWFLPSANPTNVHRQPGKEADSRPGKESAVAPYRAHCERKAVLCNATSRPSRWGTPSRWGATADPQGEFTSLTLADFIAVLGVPL